MPCTHGRGGSWLRSGPDRAANLGKGQRLPHRHLFPLQTVVCIALCQLRDVCSRILVDEHSILHVWQHQSDFQTSSAVLSPSNCQEAAC